MFSEILNLRVIFNTRPILFSSTKDRLPNQSKSNLVYQYTCKRCDSVYIGKCYRRLEDRIKEHVPAAIRRSSTNFESIDSAIRHYRLRSSNSIVEPAYYESSSVSGSAIKLHLLENPACADTYDETCFKVLATGRNKFHLDVLEGVYINHQKPILCR